MTEFAILTALQGAGEGTLEYTQVLNVGCNEPGWNPRRTTNLVRELHAQKLITGELRANCILHITCAGKERLLELSGRT